MVFDEFSVPFFLIKNSPSEQDKGAVLSDLLYYYKLLDLQKYIFLQGWSVATKSYKCTFALLSLEKIEESKEIILRFYFPASYEIQASIVVLRPAQAIASLLFCS